MSYIIIISTKEKKKGGKKSTIFTILNFFTLKQEINFPRSIIRQKDFHFSHVITHPSSYPIYTYKNSIFLHSPNVTLKFLFFFSFFHLSSRSITIPWKKIQFLSPFLQLSLPKIKGTTYTHIHIHIYQTNKKEKKKHRPDILSRYTKFVHPERERERENSDSLYLAILVLDSIWRLKIYFSPCFRSAS